MKKFTKIVSLLLTFVLVMSLCACTSTGSENKTGDAKMKAGFIFLHDENSTYDRNFMEGAKAACEAKGVNYLEKVGIPSAGYAILASENVNVKGVPTFETSNEFGNTFYIASEV